MSAGTPAPAGAGASACGGLRRDLLQQWQRGFPIEHSPFQAVARRAGGSLREVLGHCQALADAGALDRIRVHWSARLARVQWRCFATALPQGLRDIEAALQALPGVTGLTLVDAAAARDGGVPALWFDIVAHDARAAAAQLARVDGRLDGVAVLELAGGCKDHGHDCDGGPCCHAGLAQRCEAGLPLVAHPFERLAAEQHASEREVLATLRRWQRSGALQWLTLAPPPPLRESSAAVLWLAAADDAQLQSVASRLRGACGVGAVEMLPPNEAWPWRLMAAAGGVPPQACRLLERALAAAGAGERAHRVVPVRRFEWRGEPLLFAQIEG